LFLFNANVCPDFSFRRQLYHVYDYFYHTSISVLMTKTLHLITCLLLAMLLSPVVMAQFPYNESFRNATAQGVVFGGSPSAFLTAAPGTGAGGSGIDPVGNGYLRLTNNKNNQKGFVYSTSSFPSSKGLSVDFEYYAYGGSGADGISLFLF